MSTVYYGTIGGLGRPRLGVLERRPVGWGGGTLVLSGTDIMNGRKREAAAGAAVRVPCRQ